MHYLLLTGFALLFGYLSYRRGSGPIWVASVMGMAMSLGVTDTLVAGLLRLYEFRPHLAPTVSQDNPVGFLLSDFAAVPLLYAAGATFFPRRRVLMSLGLALLLAGIERWFLHAGVFVHHAWSTWYSVVLFSLRFLVAAWWVPRLERVGYTKGFRAFLIAVSTSFAWFLWTIPVSSLLRLWTVRPGLLVGADPDRVLGMTLYHGLPFFAIAFLAVWLEWGRTVRGSLLTAGLLVAYLYWLGGSGLWRQAPGWSPLLEGAALTALVVAVSYLDRWFAAQLPVRERTGVNGG